MSTIPPSDPALRADQDPDGEEASSAVPQHGCDAAPVAYHKPSFTLAFVLGVLGFLAGCAIAILLILGLR